MTERETWRLWSLMWAQIFFTASAREDSGTPPKKSPRTGETGFGLSIPRGAPGVVEAGFAFVLGFDLAAEVFVAVVLEAVADLAGAKSALQALKTLDAANDIADGFCLSVYVSLQLRF
ncbi:hypothetical protein OIU76_016411 [Salix suchowensis]|nr:hypothetical protein OIU76_016411 [Salix suchowensis]